jgi:hypothetical protein
VKVIFITQVIYSGKHFVYLGLNYLYKTLIEHKEVTLDVAVLVFNKLLIYYYNEIMRGFSNEG